jgi:hypothetical protein
MAGVDLDTGLPIGHRGPSLRHAGGLAPQLLLACVALAVTAALWMRAQSAEAHEPVRRAGGAPLVLPESAR